jgi:hypothetical protein
LRRRDRPIRYGRQVSPQLRGWLGAGLVTLATAILVIADVSDAGMRRWWAGHALTTDTVSGLLVLLVTLLIVDQVLRLRQRKDRSRAIAAQAAIMVGQGVRTSQAVSQALSGSGDRDNAGNEFRTYMMMLLVGAPVLIDEPVSRNFLEQAQYLAAEMARATGAVAHHKSFKADRLDQAVQQLKDASTPLIGVLDPATQAAVRGEEEAEADDVAS